MKTTAITGKTYDIKKYRIPWALKYATANAMLFVHSLLGCDTTSRLFGRGKGAALKRLKKDERLRQPLYACIMVSLMMN